MAELVDALLSGSSAARRGGSSPLQGTIFYCVGCCFAKMSNLKSSGVNRSVALELVSEDNIDSLLDLTLAPGQDAYVASVAVSLAQAYVYIQAWPRAIKVGAEVIGFLMLSIDQVVDKASNAPIIGIWRLIIGAQHQGLGYGAAALKLAASIAAEHGANILSLSCIPGAAGPQAFYEKQGFVPTGKVDKDGEVILSIEV